jgi:hypothetical protein
LGSKSPLQAMKDWYKLKPELFRKQPYYLTGCDMCPGHIRNRYHFVSKDRHDGIRYKLAHKRMIIGNENSRAHFFAP